MDHLTGNNEPSVFFICTMHNC